MGEWRRHAIYFAPPQGSALARFGAAWLGWDPEAGAEVSRPADAPLAATAVAEPARYGFHATLKAPFRLANAEALPDLDAATARLALALPGFALRLDVAVIGAFVALVPAAAPTALATLEAGLVKGLDGFRAQLTDAETARRRPERLDATGRAHLAAWGYPHVLDRFRFHMTLTGPLGTPEAARSALADRLQPLLAEPMPVREICRFSEAPDGRFHLVRRFPLAPA
ncbi:MAG: DUF1045 domain-containing protein [Amaricoccus sp.]|uniref:DUF1045 domain-containing protein n=1 Tax=Amaricoccus sp. TaxID=1872485 RepID=UPI0039E45395